MSQAIYLLAMGSVSALGLDPAAVRTALFATRYPATLTETDAYSGGRTLALGCLPDSLPLAAQHRAAPYYQSRNNALAVTAHEQIRRQAQQANAAHGPTRVAVILGTSTAGVGEGQDAALRLQQTAGFPHGFDYAVQEIGNAAEFL